MNFILGSSSKSRLELLKQINFIPDLVIPADIDETQLKKEKPELYVQRIALEKCKKIIENYKNDVVLTADTIGTRNKRIIRKAINDNDVFEVLNFISGKNVNFLTAFCVAKNGIVVTKKLISTKVYFKHFNSSDIDEIIKSKDVLGCACACKFEGISQGFIKKIVGSASNIMGLPLYEVRNSLISAGISSKL